LPSGRGAALAGAAFDIADLLNVVLRALVGEVVMEAVTGGADGDPELGGHEGARQGQGLARGEPAELADGGRGHVAIREMAAAIREGFDPQANRAQVQADDLRMIVEAVVDLRPGHETGPSLKEPSGQRGLLALVRLTWPQRGHFQATSSAQSKER
jgi:hypothetical protein